MTDAAPPTIFSARRRTARAARAQVLQQQADAAHWLGEAMIEDMLDRIAFMRLEPARALVVGVGSSTLGRALAASAAA